MTDRPRDLAAIERLLVEARKMAERDALSHDVGEEEVALRLREAEALVAEVGRLRATLLQVEWCGEGRSCPYCHAPGPTHHVRDCQLAKLLGRPRAEP